MKIINKKPYVYIFIILSFLILSLFSDLFLLHTHIVLFTNGVQFRDFQFHLKRIMEMNAVIHKGHLFSPYAFNYLHGSSVMSMYPCYGLIPIALILNVTSSYVVSYYVSFALIIFISLIISFFSSLTYNNCKMISYTFAILYSFSLAFIFDYFYNIDIGMTTSLTFFPLAIFGFLNILHNSKRNNYLELTIGISLMALCQIPTTAISIGLILLWSLINIKSFNMDIFKNLLKSLILTCLLTSIIWIPLMKIVLFNNISTPGNVNVPLLKSSIITIIKNVGIIPIIVIIISCVLFNKLNKISKQMLLISMVIICVSMFIPFKIAIFMGPLRIINKFQFTARFLIIPNILLCYLSSLLIVKLLCRYNKKCLLIGLLLFVISCQSFSQIYLVHRITNGIDISSYSRMKNINLFKNSYFIKENQFKYVYNGFTYNRDYYPLYITRNRQINYVSNNKAVYQGNHTINIKHIGYNKFMFYNTKKIKRLTLPLFKYNNEHLCVYLNNNLAHFYINKNNLITLNNVRLGSNKLKIQYVPNISLLTFKYIVFLIGIYWVIIICINRLKKLL